MTVQGQPPVVYGYDDANRLTSVTQGTSVVTITFDDANRRYTLTLPNGIVRAPSYDDANQSAGLTYTLGSSTIGSLTYSYDLAGRRTDVGGSWARTGLPESVSGTNYDSGNRVLLWPGAEPRYDANGNQTSDGLLAFGWNSRDQLTAVDGSQVQTFQYDSFDRRTSITSSGSTLSNSGDDGVNTVEQLVDGFPVANLLSGQHVDEFFDRFEGTRVRTCSSTRTAT